MLLVRAEPPAPPAATLGDTSKRDEYDREMARKNDIATHRWNSDVFSSGGAQTRSSQAAAAKKRKGGAGKGAAAKKKKKKR